MKKLIVLLLGLTAAATDVCAQARETFDIASFAPPPAWKRESNDVAVSYVVANNKTGSWCRVSLYKSQGSSGDAATDFAAEWKALLGKEQGISDAPAPQATSRNGWSLLSGSGRYRFGGKEARARLVSMSGHGRQVSVLVQLNSDEFAAPAEAFVSSVEIILPNTAQPQAAPAGSAAPPIVVTGRPGNQGITIATTNFDDGWVAQPFADYVRVAREQTVVLLHYGIEITDEMRQAASMARFLWDRIAAPRYSAGGLREYQNEPYAYDRVHFVEADAVDRSSGQKVHVGLRVVVATGIASVIEIISPSRADFQRLFPTQEKVAAMLNYNKFAVAQADLAGTWEESGSSSVAMYSTVTGAYAGMSTTGAADSFTFNTDGTYQSTHKGLYGMVGNMTVFDNKYEGRCTVSPWEITVTNRFGGKTEVFSAQYQAVRGGRILHLTNKAATGIQYHLARTR